MEKERTGEPRRISDAVVRDALRRAEESSRVVELVDGADSRHAGLRVRCNPAGSATASVVFAHGGRTIRRTIGPWWAFGGSIATARQAAWKVRGAVLVGADPLAAKREARAARAAAKAARDATSGPTMHDLLAAYERHREAAGRLPKGWAGASRRLVAILGADLMRKPLHAITVEMLQQRFDAWPAASTSLSAMAALRPVLRWGARPGRKMCAADLALLDPPAGGQSVPRDRVLSADELRRLLPVLRTEADHGDPYAHCMKLLILTGCRREEVAGAVWGDVDLTGATLAIPASRSKNGRARTVLLSRQATDVFEQMRGGLDRVGPIFTKDGRALRSWGHPTRRYQRMSGTKGWHRHDLRRTAATVLGDAGVAPHIVELVLGHTLPGPQVARVYNRSVYETEVRAAVQALADRLDVLEAEGTRAAA